MRFEPEKIYLQLGEKAYVHLTDDQGETLLMGRKDPFIVFNGHDHKDARIEFEGTGRLNADSKGLMITMVKEGSFCILYNHPSLEGSAYLEVNYMHAHSHKDMCVGGPAVGAFNAFQV